MIFPILPLYPFMILRILQVILLHLRPGSTDLGELFTNLKLFPFMYRGRVSDANLAVDNGWYEIFGDISNAPFTQSWGPLFVIGHSYKVQFAFYSVSDGFKLYVRQLNHTNFGWNKIDLTQV